MSSDELDLSLHAPDYQLTSNATTSSIQHPHSDLSHPQYVFMVACLWAGSLLNLLGSFTLLYSVCRKRQNSVYHRLLAAMSLFEIGNALNWIVLPFMDPRGTPGLYWAIGNTTTCSISGFLVVGLLLPTWMYSAYLSVYFLLVINYSWTEKRISKCLEVPAFLLAIGVSLGGAISGVATESFNARPSELLCITENYPYDCLEDPAIGCERGGGSAVGLVIVSTALGCSLVGSVCTLAIYCTVYSTFVRTSARRLGGGDRRLRTVAKQAGLYFLVYLNLLFWPVCTQLIYGISDVGHEDRGNPLSYVYDATSWFFFTYQGFLNCCVYLHPRYAAWRTASKDKGRIWAVRKAIGTDALPRNNHHPPITNGTNNSKGALVRADGVYESCFLSGLEEEEESNLELPFDKSLSKLCLSCDETELPSHEMNEGSPDDTEPVLPVAGQPRVLKTDKEQQIDQIVA